MTEPLIEQGVRLALILDRFASICHARSRQVLIEHEFDLLAIKSKIFPSQNN